MHNGTQAKILYPVHCPGVVMFLSHGHTRRTTHHKTIRTAGIPITGLTTADKMLLAGYRRTMKVAASMTLKGEPLAPTTMITISTVTAHLACATRLDAHLVCGVEMHEVIFPYAPLLGRNCREGEQCLPCPGDDPSIHSEKP